jgi:1-acyl-sn-glycerol-3-phosphate acyltransferase
VVVLQRGLGAPVTAAAMVVRPPLRLLASHRWRGAENLPSGGCVVAANHVSWLDPVTLLDFLIATGPVPRVLAKQSLFETPVVGALLRSMHAVPVLRGSGDAARALRAAEDAVRAGDRVVIFPDGTLTKDPEGWPMVGKTGAARIALATGAPVVPVAQWGPHLLLPRTGLPHLLPRPRIDLLVGRPVDLSESTGRPLTATLLREVTGLVVGAVTGLLEELRGTPAPPPWDPRTGRRVPVASSAPVARPEQA